MNRRTNTATFFRRLAVCGFFLLSLNLIFAPAAVRAADESGVVDRTKAVVQDATKDAKDSVTDAGRAVSDKFENLWRRADDTRLKNRSRDEIVAWVIMGVLVGSLAGMMTSLKSSGLGKAGRLMLGLAGAFLGGVIVHVAKFDLGMGPVLIRYEELLFAFAGAIVLIIVARLITSGAKKKPND